MSLAVESEKDLQILNKVGETMNTNQSIYIGNSLLNFETSEVKGSLITIDGERFYKISNVNEMRPFFMSIVSDANHWLFIVSNGGISAGRKNSDSALFPYYTDDKIIESSGVTGSKTILRVHKEGKIFLWEPFSDNYSGVYNIQRNLFKNSYGDKIIFEEINNDLDLIFSYQWSTSDEYGFVKKSTLKNENKKPVEVELLDGIQNILPSGVGQDLQTASSNLVDAYKRNELNADLGLGIYSLSAMIVDKAEPSEALRANVAWSLGLENPRYLLSSLQVDKFRKGTELIQELDVKAEKGAYFVNDDIYLSKDSTKSWHIIADVNKSITEVNETIKTLAEKDSLIVHLEQDIAQGTKNLVRLNASADGIQLTADEEGNMRHFSNSLFNIMRGGVFDHNYQIEKVDFENYLAKANKEVYKKYKKLLSNLEVSFSLTQLISLSEEVQNSDFKRLVLEYLPIKFSRRHGDPSRPWNKFSINTKSEIDNSKVLDYEGNWRDIFQNWEALALSFPGFIDGMIHKFLNASTFDGYNPYRVTKGGIDWEINDPEDPWAYIGYWGDHQIIYLLKFLEFIENYYPKKLESYFDQNIFVFANVPYKIKSYQEILSNSKETIVFDEHLDKSIREEREVLGADGALLKDASGEIYRVNFIEKLLITSLTKISNFIPEGGIWMNTQRPEWNDANNALVGNGVSMVTTYYLRRFLKFFEKVIMNAAEKEFEISAELKPFFETVISTFSREYSILENEKISNSERKFILDVLGESAGIYRSSIYKNKHSRIKEQITREQLLEFIKISLEFIEHTIKANKREDGLYHAYNLMTVDNTKEVSISYLSEMLEGQVAVLSSGSLSSKESLKVLDALKNSALFRKDQYSYILYPNKDLAGFEAKNNIPFEKLENSKLIEKLLEANNNQLVEKDVFGNYHFNGSFNNAQCLIEAAEALPDFYTDLVEQELPMLLNVFEEIFDHKSFTGRSGTFFGYEGLGSIYWHMVSKLLLAVQECCVKAINKNADEETIGRLLEHYYEINEGLGVHKSPELYGAFPTDAYSHTPGGKGVQQPGMTGQVKEDVLSRFGELGVFVKQGKITFNPRMLRKDEFLKSGKTFNYVSVNDEEVKINLNEGTLAFTYCQVPVIYKLSDQLRIKVLKSDGNSEIFDNLTLDVNLSKEIFNRSGSIKSLLVSIPKYIIN